MEATTMSRPKQGLIVAVLLLVAGCTKGIDRPLTTGKDLGALVASIAEVKRDMTAKEREASLWAMNELAPQLGSQADFHALYPNATLKQLIRGEVKRVLEDYPKIVAQIEPRKVASDAVLAELNKIVADESLFSLRRDFFGLKPTITARVSNNGRLPVSTLQWNASLFIEGKVEPVATSQVYDFYNESFREATTSRGFLPGTKLNRQFSVGFVSGDAAWTTIEIQNAKAPRVQLTVIPGSVKDLADKSYWDAQQHANLTNELESKQAAIQSAKSFADI